MRLYFFIGLISLIFTGISIAQEQESTVGKILENAVAIDDGYFGSGYYTEVESIAFKSLVSIFDMDIYSYFDDLDIYETPLQKKKFEKTQEYRDKMLELKNLKQEMLKKYFYTAAAFSDSRWSEYDIKQKAVKRELGSVYSSNKSKIIEEEYYLPSLPIIIVRKSMWDNPFEIYYEQWLHLPANERQGSEIETSSLPAYLIFKITGTKTVAYGREMRKVLVANTVRVVIADAETGKVYFDRVYPSGKK
ncbi:MAG: hypothetical protein Q8J64_04110 [Thermodesulfovibrionales bacterium]|nr:hypothetical protein [Thermodesulfovibrionales bacterium]